MDSELHFDLNEITVTALAQQLANVVRQSLNPPENVTVAHPNGLDYVGAGLRGINKLTIQGTVGDYALSALCDCECTVNGSVRDYVGHSIASGAIIINGHAGNHVGALGVGGLIAVYGNAGDHIAYANHGTEILIRGSVGSHAAANMQSGTLLIGGTVGPNLGCGMRGGVIYVRGDVDQVSDDIEEHRLREPDKLKIGLLLIKAGIKATAGKDFRVYKPVDISGGS